MVVVSGNDRLDSFLNSIILVENAFSPLESNFRKFAKNFEHCFNGVSKCGNLNNNVNGGLQSSDDDRGKGKVPIEKFVGIFTQEGASDVCNNAKVSRDGVEKLNISLSKKGLKEDKNRDNFLHLEVALSFLINSFVQAFPRPFKSEKTRVGKMNNEDNFCCNDSHVKIEVKPRVGGETKQTEFKVKEGNNFPFEFSIAFVFDQLNHLPNFLESVQENEFGHFRSLTSLLEGKRADVNGFLGNLKFACVGGVPLGIFGVPSVNDEGGDGITNAVNHEDTKLVAVPPPVEITAKSVLKSALAGGLSCSFSTALMHPIDTVKIFLKFYCKLFQILTVRCNINFACHLMLDTSASFNLPWLCRNFVQASSDWSPRSIQRVHSSYIRPIYESSHGLRTGIFEVSKFVLTNVAPTVPDLQVQSMASFCATVLGTVWRIPCEVLKQRLQANVFDNTGEAIVGTWKQDGLAGFFRGTGATLCREIPFYVAGAGLYAASKKAAQKVLRRELEPWETIIIGAISGGLIAISTTPFDVIKTRMMISPEGQSITASMVAFSILQSEGPLALFRGAVPRFFWVAPLGAINFAGYELLRKAMERW
ncbi:hypothetical protein BUALT_Bualt06G0013200 [Buddleja alternifolia]|uniref:Mitochondrial carrier protein n=1 Tax=Buddleja alternifolia TaxID=168488 RepID=A0AAV6XK76_9LAMI|nr:hypothetical protein BUALT_Bualt06G0013200 [Buddleja alternifolia]